MLETRDERYERYLKNNQFWFASSLDMEKWAIEKEKQGVLKRLWELIPYLKETDRAGNFKDSWAYAWVYSDWTIHDLTKVFKRDYLVDCFGLSELEPIDYQI